MLVTLVTSVTIRYAVGRIVTHVAYRRIIQGKESKTFS